MNNIVFTKFPHFRNMYSCYNQFQNIDFFLLFLLENEKLVKPKETRVESLFDSTYYLEMQSNFGCQS